MENIINKYGSAFYDLSIIITTTLTSGTSATAGDAADSTDICKATPNLHKLTINGMLTSFDNLVQLQYLTILSLRGDNDTVVPSVDIPYMSSLRELTITNYRLESITIANIPLIVLDLSYNILQSLPILPETLEYLDLKHNVLNGDIDFDYLKNLRVLDVSDNCLIRSPISRNVVVNLAKNLLDEKCVDIRKKVESNRPDSSPLPSPILPQMYNNLFKYYQLGTQYTTSELEDLVCNYLSDNLDIWRYWPFHTSNLMKGLLVAHKFSIDEIATLRSWLDECEFDYNPNPILDSNINMLDIMYYIAETHGV